MQEPIAFHCPHGIQPKTIEHGWIIEPAQTTDAFWVRLTEESRKRVGLQVVIVLREYFLTNPAEDFTPGSR